MRLTAVRLSTGLLTLALLGSSECLLAETQHCTPITAVPYTITRSGIYCLTGDVSAPPVLCQGILVEADDVVIDLNGHVLDGTAGGSAGRGFGIHAFERRNLTIRNGTIRGFFYGVYFDGYFPPDATVSSGHILEDVLFDRNTSTGITAVGEGIVIRRNRVVATGGNTWLGLADVWGWGMQLVGTGIRVIDNDVATVTTRGMGVSTGIQPERGTHILLVGNRISGAQDGVAFLGLASGKYRDNSTTTVAVPFSGGTDAGGNN